MALHVCYRCKRMVDTDKGSVVVGNKGIKHYRHINCQV